jgi:asparagine synthase (glutamine-hydrolysing)
MIDVTIDPSTLYNSEVRGWGCIPRGRWTIRYIGRSDGARQILSFLAENQDFDIKNLKELLVSLPNEWAIIAQSAEYVVAATDKIRSYPIFYVDKPPRFVVSNAARLIAEDGNELGLDEESVLEFAMAGYVTGSNTLYETVKQLQAGEILVFERQGQGYKRHRYYQYLPQPEAVSTVNWVDELAYVTERIFRRMIDFAAGRPLLVPLSGGLDSRLIVCMLRYFGYQDVRTFSYGLPGNYEAKIARKVAATLKYPWEFIATTHSDFRDFFWSLDRKKYWEYSDGGCSIPGMQDILPLLTLRKRGLSEDTVVVNGQSGDFISGGHIPVALLDSENHEELFSAILHKHYGLNKVLSTTSNQDLMRRRLSRSIAEIESQYAQSQPIAALYESWEWQERQGKYVINAQRGYDWLGLGWHLPLWDTEYLKFWSRVPLSLKLGQRLYREYLRSRDYFGLFKNFNPTVWRWPGVAIAVVPCARVAGLLAGDGAKNQVYQYLRYIGHYGPYYAPWGTYNFIKQAHNIRNPVSLFVAQYLYEKNIEI